MNTKRGLLILAVPVLGIGLLVVGICLRPGETSRTSRSSAVPGILAPAVYETVRREPLPEAAAAPAVARAMDEDRLRSTFLNYRTAVATGNRPLAEALRSTLMRDREKALTLARATLAQGASDEDRRVSRMALEKLER